LIAPPELAPTPPPVVDAAPALTAPPPVVLPPLDALLSEPPPEGDEAHATSAAAKHQQENRSTHCLALGKDDIFSAKLLRFVDGNGLRRVATINTSRGSKPAWLVENVTDAIERAADSRSRAPRR
jgi:hypothetical protein